MMFGAFTVVCAATKRAEMCGGLRPEYNLSRALYLLRARRLPLADGDAAVC